MLKRYVLLAATVVLAIAGGLVFWGSTFAKNMVHDELAAQKITFPSAEQLKAEGDSNLAKYGGQAVDNAFEAKAFSEYINGHLAKVANGQTYSEVSAAFQKDKNNQTLAAQRQTLFMGETLRGMLLSAYGWGLMGIIAFWAAIGLWAAAFLGLVGYLYAVSVTNNKPAKKVKPTKRK